MEKNAVVLRNLCKNYPSFRLDHLNLDIPTGTIVGLVGANGAGKSTTMKLILNLIRRDSGTVTVLGKDAAANEREIKENIGVVFDEPCYHDLLSAEQMGDCLSGLYKNWDSKIFDNYLVRFQLKRKQKLKEYSRGMKMKLSIAAAMSHKPKLLLLDEPTGGLDPLVRDEILDLLLDYLQEEDHTVLLSSHITSDLDKIADTIALLDNGKLIFHEEKDTLRDGFVVVKGDNRRRAALKSSAIIGVRESQFGFEALCRRSDVPRDENFEIERPTIEEIMLFYTKNRVGAGSPSEGGAKWKN